MIAYIRFFITIILTLLTALANAQDSTQVTQKGIDITVTVKNVRGNTGKIYFGLYQNAQDFTQNRPLKSVAGTIDNGQSVVVFQQILRGTYAIKCFHDSNDNKKMDFDGFMPTEDYGSTNNPIEYGSPTFNAAKFDVNDTNLTFEILF